MSTLTSQPALNASNQASYTSSGNSWGIASTQTLDATETLTGDWVLTTHTHYLISAVVTGGSATLYTDFSIDGKTSFNTFPVNGYPMEDGIGIFHVAVKGARNFRVRVTAGADNLTSVKVHSELGSFTQPNAPLNSAISLSGDAVQVRPSSFQDEVRIGRRSGVTGWTKFAYRTGLTAASGEQVIWTASGDTFTPLTSAETFTITYTQANDGSSANGAKTLAIYYVDANGLPAVAIHTLGNDGSDVTSFTGLGINRVAVASSGSSQTNTAAITFTATTAGTTQAHIPANEGVTQQAIFFCGANHDAILKYIRLNVVRSSGGSTGTVLLKGYIFNRAVATRFLIFRETVNVAIKLDVDIVEPIGSNLSPTDVLYFVADTDTNNFEVDCRFSLNEYQRT